MNAADRKILLRLAGAQGAARDSTDDLQGLLLQVSLALLMIFMIAYFIFVASSKKEREEQLIDLNRQKLIVALERTAENRRTRYGLNALMTQGVDGGRIFDADSHFRSGRLDLAPAALAAFSAGSASAFGDYSDKAALEAAWLGEVEESSGVEIAALPEAERVWIGEEVAKNVENVRLDVRGVQRALALRLQKSAAERPGAFEGVDDPGAIADAIKKASLAEISRIAGAEVLP